MLLSSSHFDNVIKCESILNFLHRVTPGNISFKIFYTNLVVGLTLPVEFYANTNIKKQILRNM